MDVWVNSLRFLHILTVVFMSAPLYNLIIVRERVLLGPSMTYPIDRYMENLIKKNSVRCFFYQLTALITGIALVYLEGLGFSSIFTNWVLLLKTVLLLALMGLLSFVHLYIQPRIEGLLSPVKNDPIPEEIAGRIRPLRLSRTRLAGFCLFLVITSIILGVQTFDAYPPGLTITLVLLAAIFSWRVYKKPPRFGWI